MQVSELFLSDQLVSMQATVPSPHAAQASVFVNFPFAPFCT